MQVRARDGRTYDVNLEPPTGSHEVRLEGTLMGVFLLLPTETKVTVESAPMTEALLVDIADRFVSMGGVAMYPR